MTCSNQSWWGDSWVVYHLTSIFHLTFPQLLGRLLSVSRPSSVARRSSQAAEAMCRPCSTSPYQPSSHQCTAVPWPLWRCQVSSWQCLAETGSASSSQLCMSRSCAFASASHHLLGAWGLPLASSESSSVSRRARGWASTTRRHAPRRGGHLASTASRLASGTSSALR